MDERVNCAKSHRNFQGYAEAEKIKKSHHERSNARKGQNKTNILEESVQRDQSEV